MICRVSVWHKPRKPHALNSFFSFLIAEHLRARDLFIHSCRWCRRDTLRMLTGMFNKRHPAAAPDANEDPGRHILRTKKPQKFKCGFCVLLSRKMCEYSPTWRRTISTSHACVLQSRWSDWTLYEGLPCAVSRGTVMSIHVCFIAVNDSGIGWVARVRHRVRALRLRPSVSQCVALLRLKGLENTAHANIFSHGFSVSKRGRIWDSSSSSQKQYKKEKQLKAKVQVEQGAAFLRPPSWMYFILNVF